MGGFEDGSMKPAVIVTGASRGLGRATARWLARMGAHVVCLARTEDTLKQAASELGAQGAEVLALAGDVADPDFCARAVEEAVVRFERLDGLVNNAGIVQPVASIAEAPVEDWRYNIEVNLLGPFYLTRAAIPALRETRGRVVNISTGAAVQAMEGWSAYCASKAALTHFTRVLAAEEPGITSVALRPGVVDTSMQEFIRKEGPRGMPPHRLERFLQLKQKGLLEPPEVPGHSAAWLCLNAPSSWSGEFMEFDDPRIPAVP